MINQEEVGRFDKELDEVVKAYETFKEEEE